MVDVLYTAAHGGFASEQVPLGGGSAVAERLTQEWNRTKPFPFERIDPSILGKTAPSGKNLVEMSEFAYARFCLDFEKASTERVLKEDPTRVVVLCNDVSEGPDFKTLGSRGYRLFTIYHVDVLDYFTRIYLHSKISAEALAHGFSRISKTPLAKALPKIAGLIVRKQQESVEYSQGLIVPSAAMRDILLRCYPATDPAKIHVLPWGVWDEPVSDQEVDREVSALRQQYQILDGAPILLTLSRISPEKGQDRLLAALRLWEERHNFPAQGLWLFLAGEAAYMKGKQFERKLRQMASKLKRTKVIFPGFAGPARKKALFKLATLYVFPSRHESYGLTAMEAMQAGLPVLACYDHGTREIMMPETGTLLPEAPERNVPVLLCDTLKKMLSDRTTLARQGEAARRYAESQRFTTTAARVANLLSQ